jgi:hypothetical protein
MASKSSTMLSKLLLRCCFVAAQFGKKEGDQVLLDEERKVQHQLNATLVSIEAQLASITESSSGPISLAESGENAGKEHRRVVLTVSIGNRGHFDVNREFMALYALRCGADLEVISTLEHPIFTNEDSSRFLPKGRLGKCGDNEKCKTEVKSRFGKLAALTYYLKRYDRVLFLDDSCVVSPFAVNVFEAVSADAMGAVQEPHTKTWALPFIEEQCRKYEVPTSRCVHKMVFNSGVVLMSKVHLPMLTEWGEGVR